MTEAERFCCCHSEGRRPVGIRNPPAPWAGRVARPYEVKRDGNNGLPRRLRAGLGMTETERFSACQKSLAEFAPRTARSYLIVFCRGVYVAKYTYQTTKCANCPPLADNECAQ